MKKFLNSVDTMLAESLDGFAAAHADIVVLGAERKFVRRRALSPGKVALISGGGSGHEPLHVGFVGTGMLDAACPGQIFTSPTPDQIVEAAAAVGGEAGVLFIVKNYAGDCMNFEMAAELFEGPAATVVTNDDVAVEKSTYSVGRRGVAGTLVVEKIVGAAAEQGMALKSCAQLGFEVNARTNSIGAALTSCTVPAAGTPTFSLGPDEMEMGVGIHGEPGRKRVQSGERRRHCRRDGRCDPRPASIIPQRAMCCCSSTASAVRRRSSSISCIMRRGVFWRNAGSRWPVRSSAPTSPRSKWPDARSPSRCSTPG